MQKIRTVLKISFFFILNNVIKLKPLFVIFNFVFERSPYNLIVYFTRHIRIPNKNLNWKIKLYNNKIVKTRILKNNPKTWQFALSYKWHDRGLNMLETVLSEYFLENSIWIDCGANLGLRSLTPLSENIQVYMIEPNQETNSLCLERCELNNFKSYKILPYGVSNTDAKKSFYIDDSSYLSTLNNDILDDENIKSINTIEVRKLDTIFSDKLNSNLNVFIKMDIEGHEIEALEGAENLINSLSPSFVIEINEKGSHLDLIFNKMRMKNYIIYEVNDLINSTCFLKLCVPGNSIYHRNDFLFVKDQKLNDYLKNYLI